MLRYVNDIGSHFYCKKIAISCIIMNGRKIDKMAFRDTTLNVFPRSFRGDSIGKLAFIGEHRIEPMRFLHLSPPPKGPLIPLNGRVKFGDKILS